MSPTNNIYERIQKTGQISTCRLKGGKKEMTLSRPAQRPKPKTRMQVIRERTQEFLTVTFLPSNYPRSVTPDYFRYQVLNALQAFCNSLAGLLASRAVLEGFGIGDPTATANQALMLTIVQDVFGRATTIIGASALGTNLQPEARYYRLLADVLNDAALLLDLTSPMFNALSLPGLRVAALCLSAACRALCGLVAGGSKAAISLHFATPIGGKGDVADLNAKDASKETVLALLGMLVGMVVVPRLTAAWAVWSVLLVLVFMHLFLNYLAVRCLQLRTVNHQRLTLAWLAYRSDPEKILTPESMLQYERLFERAGTVRMPGTSRVLGYIHMGSILSQIIIPSRPISREWMVMFSPMRYIFYIPSPSRSPRIHVCFKDYHTIDDHRKAWFLAVEFLSMLHASTEERTEEKMRELLTASIKASSSLDTFRKGMEKQGWLMNDVEMLTRRPELVVVDISYRD